MRSMLSSVLLRSLSHSIYHVQRFALVVQLQVWTEGTEDGIEFMTRKSAFPALSRFRF